jgi:UDPglucose 6-dehydrogenase
MPNAERVLGMGVGGTVSYCSNAYEAATGTDALVIATEWNEFRNVDLERLRSVMKKYVLFDIRNILEPEKAESLGFKYYGTGR